MQTLTFQWSVQPNLSVMLSQEDYNVDVMMVVTIVKQSTVSPRSARMLRTVDSTSNVPVPHSLGHLTLPLILAITKSAYQTLNVNTKLNVMVSQVTCTYSVVVMMGTILKLVKSTAWPNTAMMLPLTVDRINNVPVHHSLGLCPVPVLAALKKSVCRCWDVKTNLSVMANRG